MNIPTRQMNWMVALLAVGLVAAYIFAVFLPGLRKTDLLRGELAAHRDFVVATSFVGPAIESVRSELEKTEAYISAWRASSPAEAELSSLWGRINALAKSASATPTRFEPQPTIDYQQLRRIPVLVECTGSFAQLSSFIQNLEGLPPTIWVESLELSENGESGEIVKCELELVIFADNPDSLDQVDLAG